MAYLLIVDDDEDFASAAAMVLSAEGHKVDIKLDIKSGEKSIVEKKPDLIILDVMFPESSTAGFELAHTIRNYDEKLKNIPMLMLTAVNAEFPPGFRMGKTENDFLPPENFLEKPVDFDILLKKVNKMVSQVT